MKIKMWLLSCLLWLLCLAGCGKSVVIENGDKVNVDYTYVFVDWTTNFGNLDLVVWDNWLNAWMDDFLLGFQVDSEFSWFTEWKNILVWEYDANNVQKYASIIMTEVLWVDSPSVWKSVYVDEMWDWIITWVEEDTDGYMVYVVDFNNPNSYSDVEYQVTVKSIEKKQSN